MFKKERTTIIKKSQTYKKTHTHIPKKKKERKKKRGKIIPDVKVILFWPRFVYLLLNTLE